MILQRLKSYKDLRERVKTNLPGNELDDHEVVKEEEDKEEEMDEDIDLEEVLKTF